MDGKKVTIVGIIAILVGLLVGYLMWGAQTKALQGELDQIKSRLAEAQKAATREKELSDEAGADGGPAEAADRRPGQGEGAARADAGGGIQGQEVITGPAGHERETPCKPS